MEGPVCDRGAAPDRRKVRVELLSHSDLGSSAADREEEAAAFYVLNVGTRREQSRSRRLAGVVIAKELSR
jgi:hypothetical protein